MDIEEQTVHIIEDEPAVLRSLMRVLTAAGHKVCGYRSSEEFLTQHVAEADGCIVADVGLPGMTGLDLQEHLCAEHCVQPIVFVTGQVDVQSTVRAMRAGALNLLVKPIEAEQLIDSVQEALQRSEIERRNRIRRLSIESRLATLTKRERQVFDLVVSGRLNKQIAAEFGVGEKTIKVHRARVMHKMRAPTLAQLVRMAGGMPSDSELHDAC